MAWKMHSGVIGIAAASPGEVAPSDTLAVLVAYVSIYVCCMVEVYGFPILKIPGFFPVWA